MEHLLRILFACALVIVLIWPSKGLSDKEIQEIIEKRNQDG